MKRMIIIIIIASTLIIGATAELIIIKNITSTLKAEIYDIIPQYENNEENISILSEKISDINKKWNKIDATLGLIFNYKDLNLLTDSLSRLVVLTENNEFLDAQIELALLKNFIEKNEYTMGFNLHNIF